MRTLEHLLTVLALVAAFLVAPAVMGGVNVTALAMGGPDLVSSATTIQAAPSGAFTLFVNRARHTDEEVLGHWLDFLAGRDVPLIMEDVSCVALAGDASGIELAESLASRLPANQMKVRVEDGTLAVSKAEVGRFDILVMSDEAGQAYGAASLADLPFVEVVHR